MKWAVLGTEDEMSQTDEIKRVPSKLRLVKKGTHLSEQLPSENKEEKGCEVTKDDDELGAEKIDAVETDETYMHEKDVFEPMENEEKILKNQTFKFALEKNK